MNGAVGAAIVCSVLLSVQGMLRGSLEDRFDLFEFVCDTIVLGVPCLSSRLVLVDLENGMETGWECDWSPESDGWTQGGIRDLDVNPDGKRVLLARVFSVSSDARHFIPGSEAVGLSLASSAVRGEGT